MKKLLIALAQADMLVGQSEQCRQLYNAKAEAMATEAVCDRKGGRVGQVNAQIKAAKCPLPTPRDIDLLVSMNLDMAYSSFNHASYFCDTPWAKKAIGY
jgi:hypothetical protein